MLIRPHQLLVGAGQLMADAVANALSPPAEAEGFEAAGERVAAWWYPAPAPGHAALLFHTALGVTAHEHRLARRLARAGCSCLLVRYAGRTSGRILESATERERLQTIADRALRHVREAHPAHAGRVTAVGLSLGGYLASWLGRPGARADGVTLWYGAYPQAEEWLRQTTVPVRIFQGLRDAPAFVAAARRLAAALPAGAVRLLPDAPHQFDLLQPHGAAAAEAWAETVALATGGRP